MEDLKSQIETKDKIIKALQDSIKLKDDQIKIYEEKIEALEKSLELKDEKFKEKTSIGIDENVIIEKDDEIKELKEKVELLNDELVKSDEEIETLQFENKSLKEQKNTLPNSKIIDFTRYIVPQSEILSKMKNIIDNSLHKVIIATPSIQDLQELYLYEVKSSVSISISCDVDQNDPADIELLEEFESLDNISIRQFEDKDRYVVLRDSEELLFGVVGEEDTNVLIFHTEDAKHIKTLNTVGIDAWLRSRKIMY